MLNQPKNRGKGEAVREGMLAAKGNWRVFMDADNSTAIVEFNKMIPYLDEGYEIVIGSRAVRGAKVDPHPKLFQQIAGKLGNLFIQIFLLRGIWDTQCGFKCFSEEAAKRIFPLMKIADWAFDVETLALAKAMGYRIKEMPIHWVNDLRTHLKWWSFLKVLVDVLKIKWWLWRKAYRFDI